MPAHLQLFKQRLKSTHATAADPLREISCTNPKHRHVAVLEVIDLTVKAPRTTQNTHRLGTVGALLCKPVERYGSTHWLRYYLNPSTSAHTSPTWSVIGQDT